MNKYLIFLTFVFCQFLLTDVQALHIVGGDVTYACLGLNPNGTRVSFRITFTMYRDSRSMGAPFDQNALFGIYRGSGNSWTHVQTSQPINPRFIEAIPIISPNPCLIVPTNLGVEKGTYEFDVTLDVSATASYLIAYQRCCRNNTINNLIDPGTTGAAFTIEITPFAQQTCNNSPTFNDFPPVVICVNEAIGFDHSATDKDGDQLVYEFCAPLTAGGTDGSTGQGNATDCTGVTPLPSRCLPPYRQVTFALPLYSFVNPMGGNPIVYIDPVTGLIDGSPNLTGQFVVGVCVKEFRNGVLLSVIQRDFQFNVNPCQLAIDAKVRSDREVGDTAIFDLCGDSTISIVNLSTDVSRISSYYWEFDINGEIQIFNTRNLDLVFPSLGVYNGKMVLNRDVPGASNCKDSLNIQVNVLPPVKADFDYVYDTCFASAVQFVDKSFSGAGPIQEWEWDFVEDVSGDKDPFYFYETPGNKPVTLIVTDINLCKDTLTDLIVYFPAPGLVVIEPNTFIGCNPGTISFNNLSKPIDETYDIVWDFGDGTKGSGLSPTHTYQNVGVYSVRVLITSPIGCTVGQVFSDWITILPKPQAGFTFTPQNPNVFNNELIFEDQSKDAISWFWQFGNLGTSFIQEPVFAFRDTGVYEIIQVVLHESGCTDTAFALIDIEPIITFFLPNAFTPNFDGLNEVFIGKGYFVGMENYVMTIWDRWGQKIFESDDPNIGWNGLKNNVGSELLPAGVFIYNVSFKDPRNKVTNLKGQVTLIR